MSTPSTQPPARADNVPDNAPHILVVDDDLTICALLGRYLMEHGFRVTQASDAASARTICADSPSIC